MRDRHDLRMRVEAGLAITTGLLALLTLVWRDWIEAVFRVDPDKGNGNVEWLAVAVLAAVALTLSLLARRDRRAVGASIE
jgi:hypothetical protein